MGSKGSPSAPICSHSPDAVPIDSSVHQVLFKCGPPSFHWTTQYDLLFWLNDTYYSKSASGWMTLLNYRCIVRLCDCHFLIKGYLTWTTEQEHDLIVFNPYTDHIPSNSHPKISAIFLFIVLMILIWFGGVATAKWKLGKARSDYTVCTVAVP